MKIKLLLAFLSAMLIISCSMTESAKPYTSSKDGFSVAFPPGGKEPVVEKPKFGDEKDAVYMTTNNNGVYRVHVINWGSFDPADSVEQQMIGSGAGSEIPLDAEIKEITFQGKPAIDAAGWEWSENTGADGKLVKMQKRIIGYRPDDKRVFVLSMKTDAKEKLTSKEANDFFNSFKLQAAK